MNRPSPFNEDRVEVMHALIRSHPLASVVTGEPHGLMATAMPVLVESDGSEFGVLHAHLARANGQVEALRSADEALVIFHGPQAYVTPGWYPSKAEHGKVVPTWNYITVKAWGRPLVIDDAAWIRSQIGRLTAQQERGRADPWAVEDAPDAFIAAQVQGIVGLQIPIVRLEGVWKMSQNRPEADRRGVVDGYASEGRSDLAEIVAERGLRPER